MNADIALRWTPLVNMTVICLGRQNAEVLTMPYDGGFLEQPTRTMQAVAVVQEIFAEQIRKEHQKQMKGVRRG